MKKIFVLFWVVFCGLDLFSQVQAVELNSQFQVDSFNINYPNFYGNLIISGTDIENLDSLCSLQSINELWIFNNLLLKNLDGLNSLDSAMTIFIEFNDSLETIDGFSELKWVYDAIVISGNDNLKVISGFNQLSSVNYLPIINNPKLRTINGFIFLSHIGRALSLTNNLKLANLEGFASLKKIVPLYGQLETTINLTYCDSLISLDAFQNLKEVDQISIQNCPLIENLNGFRNIFSNIHDLILVSNASLSDITALEAVPFSEDAELLIHDNPNLDFCSISGICGLENPWNQIYNNAPGCDSWHEIDSICSMISVTESAVPGFTLFPNPVQDELTVNFGSNQNNFAMSLYSVSGILIRTYQVSGDNFRMDVSDLPGGVYMLFIDNSFVAKFLKLK